MFIDVRLPVRVGAFFVKKIVKIFGYMEQKCYLCIVINNTSSLTL